MKSKQLKILKIDSSVRSGESVTKALTNRLVEKILTARGDAVVTTRTLPGQLPFLSAATIEAMSALVPQQLLQVPDELARELRETDILIIGAPVYNFGIPASLKAYIDLVVRAGVTFRYTTRGAEGIVKGVKAFIVVASDSTAFGSYADYVSGYLKHVLAFIGIHDIQFIDATQVRQKGQAGTLVQAHDAIDIIVSNIATITIS
jgi:FMN-dependent NADH-azoreductase